jgi:hypothetical protein
LVQRLVGSFTAKKAGRRCLRRKLEVPEVAGFDQIVQVGRDRDRTVDVLTRQPEGVRDSDVGETGEAHSVGPVFNRTARPGRPGHNFRNY